MEVVIIIFSANLILFINAVNKTNIIIEINVLKIEEIVPIKNPFKMIGILMAEILLPTSFMVLNKF